MDRSSYFTAMIVAMLLAMPAFSQPPRNSCDGTEDTGPVTLPFNGGGALGGPISNSFTLPGASCNEHGEDHVTCFTPENSCSVDITCTDTLGGFSTSVNLFTGTCTTPSSCLGTATATGMAVLTAQSLTAGQHYCVICETANATQVGLLNVDIVLNSGDCGALPVELISFAVESTESDGS